MRGVYGLAMVLASGLVACAQAGDAALLESRYDESKSVAGGRAVAAPAVPAAASAPKKAAAAPVASKPAGAAMEAASAKALVEAYFSSIKTLRAQFSQTVTGEAFVQEGVFYLKKPRQFLWRYETPNRQKVVGTGTAVYYQDEDTGQVTRLPSNSGVTKMFTEGRLDLDREGVLVERALEGPAGQEIWLRLKDKNSLGGGEITALKLTFGKDPAVLRRIEVTDVTGAVTDIRLNDVTPNRPVDAKLFRFEPMQGRS